MSTITEMTDEHAPAAVPAPASGRGEGTAASAKRDRALVIPVPTAITAALVAGMFGLLFVSLNGLGNDIEGLRGEIGALRSDMDSHIGTLRSDMDSQIGSLRGDMGSQIGSLRGDMGSQIGSLRGDMDARFREVNTILLDHTDRLARIETHLGIRPPADTQAAEAQP